VVWSSSHTQPLEISGVPDGRRVDLAETVIPAGNLIRLRSRPAVESGQLAAAHDRKARLFGELGQEVLGRMRVLLAMCRAGVRRIWTRVPAHRFGALS
jgi:hypothetical protein